MIFSPFFPFTFFVSCFFRKSDDILHELVSWRISHPFYSEQNTHYCWIHNLSFLKPFLLMVLLSVFLLSPIKSFERTAQGFWRALKHTASHLSISCIPWLTRAKNHFSARMKGITSIITECAPSILSVCLLSFSLVAVARRRFIDGCQSRRKT